MIGVILRNLTFQLLEKTPKREADHQIVQTVRLNEKTPFIQSTEAVWLLRQKLLQDAGQVRIVLDSQDECNNAVAERRSFSTGSIKH
jgi:hypothetical protein